MMIQTRGVCWAFLFFINCEEVRSLDAFYFIQRCLQDRCRITSVAIIFHDILRVGVKISIVSKYAFDPE